ncbi:MAG: bacteriocin [Dysgonamonadaceae bacterium]|jgi:bacteriocin-like protein|nr:bacteriocin [Dysgonamonadaceae bacterium]
MKKKKLFSNEIKCSIINELTNNDLSKVEGGIENQVGIGYTPPKQTYTYAPPPNIGINAVVKF